MKGIDVSEHQGNINWDAVKNAGINFAIIRAGFGKGNLDDEFLNNVKNANATGIPVGIYWFSYAYNANMAKIEAQKCLELIKPYKIALPIFFDFEYDSVNYANKNGVNVNKNLFNDMCVAFCSEIEKAGYKAGVYYNLDYFNTYVDLSRIGKYVQWYAQYAAAPLRNADIWQYSERGQVAGINGSEVDMNVLNNTSLLNNIETNYNNLVEYEAHIQSIGWQGKRHGGETAGTTGQAKRLEALTIKWEGKGKLYFEGHIQNLGWTSKRTSGEIIGTVNEALRLEAIKIWLENSDRKLKYRVHVQSKGWSNWVSEKEVAGTTGQSLRIEAIEIKVE